MIIQETRGDVSNGRAIQKQLLMSGLEILARKLGSQLEWISCWRVGEKSRQINMVRIDTTKGDIVSVCPLGGSYDGQGGTSRTFHFESTQGRKNGQSISHVIDLGNVQITIAYMSS